MAVLTPAPKMQFFTAAGEPLSGGKLYTYEGGTTTPLATFTDYTGATSNPNPVILNGRGEAGVWLGENIYKFRLTDSNDVEIWTVDYISAPISAVSPVLIGSVAINTNSASPALKITQTGTGDVLKVQDSTDPDITPFVIASDGRVGIGISSPTAELDVNNGTIQISSGATSRTKVYADGSNTYFTVEGARTFALLTNSVTRLTVNSSEAAFTVPVTLPASPTQALQAATKSYADANIAVAAPPGAITAYAGAVAPTGWLLCDGAAVSRSTYPALFAALGSGTIWGSGDGSTTFNVPDFRGVFLRGTGTNNTGASVGATGPALGAYQADAYLNHTHGITDPQHTHTFAVDVVSANTGQTSIGSSAAGSGLFQNSTGVFNTVSNSTGITVNNSTTGGTETRSKNYGILYIIKT